MGKARPTIAELAGTPELWRDAREKVATLTTRELQVLLGLVRGLTHREISEELGVSIRTVDIHRLHMNKKLGEDARGAVRIAIYAALAEKLGSRTRITPIQRARLGSPRA